MLREDHYTTYPMLSGDSEHYTSTYSMMSYSYLNHVDNMCTVTTNTYLPMSTGAPRHMVPHY